MPPPGPSSRRYQLESWLPHAPCLDSTPACIQALQELDKHHSGSATLRSRSPGELCIGVFALDRVGHLGIQVDLTKDTWLSAGTPVRQALTVTFELDPTPFPTQKW